MQDVLALLPIATPAFLAAWAGWMLIKQYYLRTARELQVVVDQVGEVVHFETPSKPTQEEQFMLAFYQAWIEPTQEIINLIDAECPDPEPEPEQEYYTDDFGQPTCVPCDHTETVPWEEYERLRARMNQQHAQILALESRLKEVLDHSIQQQQYLKYGSPIDTKRMFR